MSDMSPMLTRRFTAIEMTYQRLRMPLNTDTYILIFIYVYICDGPLTVTVTITHSDVTCMHTVAIT